MSHQLLFGAISPTIGLMFIYTFSGKLLACSHRQLTNHLNHLDHLNQQECCPRHYPQASTPTSRLVRGFTPSFRKLVHTAARSTPGPWVTPAQDLLSAHKHLYISILAEALISWYKKCMPSALRCHFLLHLVEGDSCSLARQLHHPAQLPNNPFTSCNFELWNL